ncbi:MAG: hypothetical protein HQ546_00850, partial [Planctomycetes bacterium]|nr:hypothetical protein [Planctomycetota bacterium]
MRRLWAVARQTFIESIRARVTVVFMFALGGAILLAPVIASGPGLREQVQTTLVYSVGLASIIISVLTILLGCSLLCGEIQSRQIFTPITKPVPRWQYIVGRWLGLALLEVMLVAGAGAATYVSVKVLCYQASDAGARLAVENEVLCSRVRHEPTSAGKTVREMIAERIEELQKEGKLEEAIAKDGPEAVQKALQTWASNRLQQFQTAPFLGGLQWFFTGLQRPAGANAMIQFRFKAKTTRDPPDKALHCQWIFTNPDTGVFFARPNPTNRAETFPIDIETTFTLPGQVI